MNKTIYMVVTADQFELPMFVSDDAKEIAEFVGINKNSVFRSISRCLNGDYKAQGKKIVKTEIDEEFGFKKICPLCKTEFYSESNNKKYCSKQCQYAYYNFRK